MADHSLSMLTLTLLVLSYAYPVGTAWSTSFDTTAGRSMEVRVPFSKLTPTRFARTIDVGRPFNKSQVMGKLMNTSRKHPFQHLI